MVHGLLTIDAETRMHAQNPLKGPSLPLGLQVLGLKVSIARLESNPELKHFRAPGVSMWTPACTAREDGNVSLKHCLTVC